MMHHAVIKYYANPKHFKHSSRQTNMLIYFMKCLLTKFLQYLLFFFISRCDIFVQNPRVTLLRFLSWQWFERYCIYILSKSHIVVTK